MTKKIIAHVTDSHLGQKLVMGGKIDGDRMSYETEPEEHENHLRLVLDDIVRKGISDLIFGGDIGNSASVAGFFEILRGYDLSTSLLLGNHDLFGNVAPHYDCSLGAIDGKLCYSRDDGFWKYVFLDSSSNTVSDDQLIWLAQELKGARNIALFVHHPILEIDTPIAQSGAALQNRHELKALLTEADCDVSVFCGHFHMIDEAREANIRQFVSPAVSYQIIKQADRLRVDTKTFGYRILEIDGADIRTQAVLLTEA